MISKPLNHNLYLIILVLITVTLLLPMIANNIAIGFLIIFFLINIKNLKRRGTLILYLLPIIILSFDVISVFNSIDIKEALHIIEKRSTLLIFSICFLLLPKVTNKQLSIIFKFFIFCVTVVCITALTIAAIKNYNLYGFDFNYQSVWLTGHHKFSKPVGLHATYLSNYILFALSILYFYKNENFKFPNKWKYIITILMLICFVLLSVRTAFVSLVILCMYLAYDVFKNDKKKLFLAFLTVGMGITILYFNNTMLRERFEDVFSIGKSAKKSRFGGSKIRMYNWESALSVFQENPVFGVGNGDVQHELEKKYEALNQNEFDLSTLNSHNQYLNALATKGIIGFISIIMFLIIPLIIGYKRKNKLLQIFIVMHLISMVTENVLTLNQGIIFLLFFYGLLCSNLDYNLLNEEELNESITST